MFIVLINANAGWVRKKSLAKLIDTCQQILGKDGRVFVTRAPEDMQAIFDELNASEITALVPVGGDGTLSGVLSAALARWSVEDIPAVLPLHGGTMNMVALSARQRRRERPWATLARVVSAWRAGNDLLCVRRSLLRSDTGRAGFVAGIGVPTRFLEHYYAKGGGLKQALATLAHYSSSTLLRGRQARALFAAAPVRLSIDDNPPTQQSLSLLMAMTIDTLPLGFQVGTAATETGEMTLLVGTPNPVRLVGSLPLIYRGQLPAMTGVRRQYCQRIQLEFAQPQCWQLDGDILPPVKQLVLDAGSQVRLLV